MTTQGEAFRSSSRGVPAGTSLNGIYQIDEMIGAGGMGEIYRGHEIQTGAAVAIKMLLSDVAENEVALALFRREAAALHNLPHDAIVRYFLFTVEPVLQRPYLAMEFVDGRSLSDMLQDGPLAFEPLVKLLRRVASGLEAAHERGIIHRDVSPDNIIVPKGDVTKAKIIDFGIARSTQLGDPTIIGSGFAGKQNYVSPEQIGLYGGDVTPKSDIYSLGLVVYYAATGQKLDMGGSHFQLVEKRRKVPDLSAVDPRLQPLLELMLQPDPASRPASMEHIANWVFPSPELRGGAKPPRAGAVDAGSKPRPAPVPREKSRGRGIVIALAALLLIGGGGAAYYVIYSPPPETTRLTPPPNLAPNALPNAAPNPPAPIAPPRTEPPRPDQPRVGPVTPPPALPPGGALNRNDLIRNFVERYDGDCFFAVPVAISPSGAVIEGFAATQAGFDGFSQGFRRELGFDPAVGARQVTPAQCPAIKFLGQLRGERARTPRISLAATEVKSGETLNGSVENTGNQVVELLLVTDTGQVQNLTGMLKPGIDSQSFSIGLQRADAAARPQLLLAVASPRPIEALRKPATADQLFPQALNEAQLGSLPVLTAARYFRLGK